MALRPGESAAIMGPSGSGKSTLLNIIGTLEPPTRGRVMIGGRDPYVFSGAELARFRNRQLGFVFQDHHLLPQCSALENVLIPALAGKMEADVIRRARTLLERIGMGDRLDSRPAELSGGERQRVAIARALIHRPTLLLADEPTGNLDRHTANVVATLLLDLHGETGTTLLVATHSIRLASRLARRYELVDGTLQEI